MDCECTGHGLSCCGVGYNAGAFAMDGCKRVKLDKCCFQFVKTDDPSINCTKPQCPRPHENEISTTIVTKN
ncbi:hypothetical protein SNE40_000908 [Patella caerulea]|uniref:Uncharacterized protein n=1 Tax=Patella caerulea TaxID=87958 RepID=A0AAN8KI58_PATCE